MTIEQLIDAKVRMIEADARMGIAIGLWCLIISGVLGLCAAVLGLRRKDPLDTPTSVFGMLAFVFGIFGAPLLGANLWKLKTAEMRARADLANYNLVELKKSP